MNSSHWDKIYSTKNENEVSWFQEIPQESIKFISELSLSHEDAIIDIGGGESHLTDHLLSQGYKNISVLDISEAALIKLKQRLNGNPSVKFIVSDVTEFKPSQKFKLWHDRATFHFLTTTEQIESYLKIAFNSIEEDGFLIVSTSPSLK
jgi:trans-aconitate methyltransferase